MNCETCGKTLAIGEYPFCPHERVKSGTLRHFRFEPYVDNYIAEHPVEITSPGHRDRLMKANHLEVRDREHIHDLNQRRYTKGLPPLPR